jgi:hypothetical protein
MPKHGAFARHVGDWEGTYTQIDRLGRILDHHRSRLECRIDGDTWSQKNRYTWDDGRVEEKQFDGTFVADGRVAFDTPRLKGVANDADGRAITLHWTYTHEPANEYYEIITLVDDTHRARTWQHFEGGKFVKLTIIDERKVG